MGRERMRTERPLSKLRYCSDVIVLKELWKNTSENVENDRLSRTEGKGIMTCCSPFLCGALGGVERSSFLGSQWFGHVRRGWSGSASFGYVRNFGFRDFLIGSAPLLCRKSFSGFFDPKNHEKLSKNRKPSLTRNLSSFRQKPCQKMGAKNPKKCRNP